MYAIPNYIYFPTVALLYDVKTNIAEEQNGQGYVRFVNNHVLTTSIKFLPVTYIFYMVVILVYDVKMATRVDVQSHGIRLSCL